MMKQFFDEVDKDIRKEHRHCVRVIGHTGDELADRNRVELLMGQGFDVDKEILADFGKDASARPSAKGSTSIYVHTRETIRIDAYTATIL